MKRFRPAAVLIAVAAFMWWIWPTPWQVVPWADPDAKVFAVRVHRLSGRVQVLSPLRGWIALRSDTERREVSERAAPAAVPPSGQTRQ